MKVNGKMIFETEEGLKSIPIIINTQESSKMAKLMVMESTNGGMKKNTMANGKKG